MNHPTEQIELTDNELAQVEGGWWPWSWIKRKVTKIVQDVIDIFILI